ncbi:type III pantothenate kinase [Luteimonas aquatica]|uniref:type III pantothenate kinase n=1 Tax=Luteimonas aquatica TaxID=450364 RepID=UPI001F5AA5DE|nr:type III pantothenate kinase [Luteimonas aquatica]
MTVWLFDLGNSRLKCAPLREDGGLGGIVHLAHDGAGFGRDWQAALPERIEAAYVSSVAQPALRVALLDALTQRCGRISLARTQARFGEVRIAYARPERLGVDRFLALLAARARDRAPTLLAGIGTALTIDLLDGDGRHRGGRIAPSPALMRAVLHARAAQLPEQGGRYAEFADDTDDALASGCDGAALALVERSLRAATDLLGQAPRLLVHGGGAEVLFERLPQARAAPSLVLEGLAIWATASDGR